MLLAYAVVITMGLALITTGLIYWVKKEALKSDPILIASCFGSGAFLIASSLVSSL